MSMTRDELCDAARKAFGDGGYDAAASWAQLADLGWFMMTVPEARGGLGLGAEALVAIHFELGRALVPGGAIAQMLAIEVLSAVDGQDARLAAAMAGERIAVSLGQPGDPLACVVDADQAAQVLVIAPDAIVLAPIVGALARATWDETRRLCDVSTGAATTLAEGAAAAAIADRVQSRLLLALAADSLGAAEAMFELTVDYLKARRQFDRPIALFQALKHRVADMKTWLDAAEALLWGRTGEDTTLAQAAALKAHATTVACRIAEEAIQLHGGIGLTAEHACHRYFKRIFLNAALGGDADHWNEAAGRAALSAFAD